MSLDKTPKIRVLVRKRPLSKKEQLKGEIDIIIIENNQTVVVREQKLKVDLTPYTDEYKFNFDGVYDDDATNEQIYLTSIRPLVDCAFDGARVSCFAYGQTGSGKTYTMLGDGHEVRGLYLLAAYDIFQQISHHDSISVWISFYEIYCGKLYDLLNDRNVLFAREDAKNNVNIVGLSERKIMNVDNLMQIIDYGTGVRVTAQNGTNVDSSRSHAILQISLKSGNKTHGKISFTDLAGSERAADHADQLEKQTRIDGAEINKSLLALKECIRALDQNKHHKPFRGSKLTMVLKDSFTGYCRTVMIGNISPNSTSSENTLNTLKYADRVKELKKPKENQMHKLDNLDQLSKELMLPRQLVNHKKYNHHGEINDTPLPYQHAQRENNHYSSNFIQQSSQRTLENVKNPRLSVPQTQYQNQSSSPGSIRHRPQSQMQSSSLFSQYNGLVQQKEPQMDGRSESLEELTRKHEGLIQLVINEEEELMACHEKHINNTIELVKEEMFLMNEADKIGSNIEKYLDNLDQVYSKQLASIYQVRERIDRLRYNLKESERIEKVYIEESNGINGGEDEILLDDDEHLFY